MNMEEDLDYSTTYVREPRDDARIRDYAERFREQGGAEPPIVVHTDSETQKRWIVSDPHRHAAATRSGVDIPTVELREVFREAGREYDRELARARSEERGHSDAIIAERIFVGSQEWVDRLIGTLPVEVQRKYWTES